jgi:hypothetical protein
MSPALSGAFLGLVLSGERKELKRRRLGLDRGKKVYYILYKLIEMIRLFLNCEVLMKIWEIWQGDN